MQYGVLEIENLDAEPEAFGDWVAFTSDQSVVHIAADVVLALVPLAREIVERMEKENA